MQTSAGSSPQPEDELGENPAAGQGGEGAGVPGDAGAAVGGGGAELAARNRRRYEVDDSETEWQQMIQDHEHSYLNDMPGSVFNFL